MTDPTSSPTPPLAERVAALKQTHLECRNLGHAWRTTGATYHADSNAYHVTYRCTRCGCGRRSWLDSHGRPTGNTYDYPEGYALAGYGHLDRDERGLIRLTQIERIATHPDLKVA